MQEQLMEQLKTGAIGLDKAKNIPMPPTFTDKQQERAYLKSRLAAAFRLFALYGYDDGLAGHITARDPIEPDTFWVNPVGLHFSRIKASDLVRLDHDGNLVEGESLVNTAAFMIHSRIHATYPHINAVAHSHSPAGRAWSTQGRPLEPLTQDSCVFFEKHDVLNVFVSVKQLGNTSFTLEAEIHHADDGRAIASSQAVYVMMTNEPFEKTPVPDDLRELFQVGAPGVVIDQSGR